MTNEQLLVFENTHFRAEQARSCVVPGYIIVTAKDVASSLSMLQRAAAESLGPTLTLVTSAIEIVLRPEIVYCARFGEETRQLHFHVFPRSARLTQEYRSAHPEGIVLHGPLILNWARERYSVVGASEADRLEVARATTAIRAHIQERG